MCHNFRDISRVRLVNRAFKKWLSCCEQIKVQNSNAARLRFERSFVRNRFVYLTYCHQDKITPISMSDGRNWLIHIGSSYCRNRIGILACWHMALTYWHIGILTYWRIDILAYWHIGILSVAFVLAYWHIGRFVCFRLFVHGIT